MTHAAVSELACARSGSRGHGARGGSESGGPGGRLPQPSFQHPIWNWCQGGGLGWQVISHCILHAGNVLPVQGLKVLF
jgi:hypothetical protein